MQYLVEMELSSNSRSKTAQEGVVFIERYVLPTLELCNKLQDEKKIIAGGPVLCSVQFALIIEANSDQELDGFIESFHSWPLMETTVTPLTNFNGREHAARPRLERLKSMAQTVA